MRVMKQTCLSTAEKEASEYGIDLEMLFYNLSLPTEQRIQQHQQALNSLTLLQNAKKLSRITPITPPTSD